MLQPVFEAILQNATRICEANFGNLVLYDGEVFHRVAVHNAPEAWATEHQRDPRRTREQAPLLYRLLDTKEVVHVADIDADMPSETIQRFTSARTLVLVPMLKGAELVGVIGVYRQEVRPFTDKQVALLRNFAAQAVIAIENARLLNELRQSTADLTESLEQQTATADVLRVISSSPGELKPVFRSMLNNATRICDAKSGFLFRAENDGFRIVASSDAGVDVAGQMEQRTFKFGPSTPNGRAQLTRQIVHVRNLAEDQAYLEGEPLAVWAVEQAHIRTLLVAPMLKDEELIGIFGIQREEVKPFTDKQIALMQTFAAQAVIAIENTRLLNELRQSLEQQTATSEVLRVISSSPGELDPVFQAMLENATRICAAEFGMLFSYDGALFNKIATRNVPPALLQFLESRGAFAPPPGTTLHEMLTTRRATHDADASAAQMHSAPVRLGGAKSFLNVPMFKDDALIGAIAIYRQEIRPFTDKQIELLTNFAAQAVIAIENARLLNELRESLEQQTATADVLQIISMSISVGLGPQIGIQKGPLCFTLRTISARAVGVFRGCGDGASAGCWLIVAAALEAPAVIAGLDDIAVVGQAIEQRGRHLGIAEDARPFTECEVGGDDD